MILLKEELLCFNCQYTFIAYAFYFLTFYHCSYTHSNSDNVHKEEKGLSDMQFDIPVEALYRHKDKISTR